MTNVIDTLRIPVGLHHLPIAAQWKSVSLVHPPPGTTATFGTLDGRILYRFQERSNEYVSERAKIISGEYRPSAFYLENDWNAVFPILGEWIEVMKVTIDKSDLPAAYRRICDETISDMIRQVAKDRGVSEDELTKEIDAKAEENMRLLAELD